MSDSSAATSHPTPPPSEDRLVALELLVTHLQYDVEQMNVALREQQREIQSLHGLLARLERRVTQLQEPPEIRDPEAERPPHY